MGKGLTNSHSRYLELKTRKEAMISVASQLVEVSQKLHDAAQQLDGLEATSRVAGIISGRVAGSPFKQASQALYSLAETIVKLGGPELPAPIPGKPN